MGIFGNEAAGRPTQFGRIFPPDTDWLKKQPQEEALEPELPIIDTHHHLWDLPNNNYLIPQYTADLATGHNVISTVYVECMSMYRACGPRAMRPIGETEFVAGMAAMSASGNYGTTKVAAGIVGFADLSLGSAVEEVLAAHISVSNGRFRGVRYAAGWDEDETIGNSHTGGHAGMLREPSVQTGLKRLEEMGLSLDAWVFHPQLNDVITVADTHPNLNIILGHCGGPLGYGSYAGRKNEVFTQWKASIAELAKRKNVTLKLGGVMMRLAAFDYLKAPRPPSSDELAALWGPYIETCIDLFGVERCMFESNFPVEKMGTGYLVLWNTFKRITAEASSSEKLALYRDTAKRAYRLE